ncbi:MAG: Ku protein [Cellvibrio sp.]|uniref:non-homologous end joining protein Ku n=1 Tax=Cellvibrio sp. TaxID=1965322 RepID=UPI00271C3B65|nr:Ku protein [Cellvibrio sp.]
MARSIWKGAISFGLVHIPVALVSATSSDNVDFDWLDKRTMDRVGYKRINKTTGKEVKKEHIVKGIQYEKDRYVVLSEDEIRAAHPKSTQTIDIFSFVDRADIPLANIDTPYYLAPEKRGEKVYALLREALVGTGKVGLANVILHTKQHLAAVMVIESALVLVLLRWPNEVKDLAILELTSATTKAQLNKSEKEMAMRLVNDMSGKWNPDDYRDTFQEKIMSLIDRKVTQGKIENVETDISEAPRRTADIIDLTALLKQSLGGRVRNSKPSKMQAQPTTLATAKKAKSKSPASSKSPPAKTTKVKATKDSSKTSADKKAGKKSPVGRKKIVQK